MPMYKQWCKPPSHKGSGRSHWEGISVTGTGVEDFEEPPAAEEFAGEPPAAEEVAGEPPAAEEVAGEPAGAEEEFDESPIAEEEFEGPPDAAIDDFEEQPKFERPNILGLSAKRHARPKNSESHRPKRKHVLDSYDKPAAPGDDSMWSAAGPEGQVVIAPKQKFAEPLPQTLPLVNFYSFGRETRMVRDHVDPTCDNSVSLYLDAMYGIANPFIYNVEYLSRISSDRRWLQGRHWGEAFLTLEKIANSSQFTELINVVRPTLEAQLSQGSMLHNVVFTCRKGRHRSVAAAKLFQAMLGTHLPFRCMCMCTSMGTHTGTAHGHPHIP